MLGLRLLNGALAALWLDLGAVLMAGIALLAHELVRAHAAEGAAAMAREADMAAPRQQMPAQVAADETVGGGDQDGHVPLTRRHGCGQGPAGGDNSHC